MDNNMKFKKSQILKLFVIITLLGITPVVSESLRTPYLYFVVNLLIIALGAEAGLLSFIFKFADQDKKKKKLLNIPTEEESSATATTNKLTVNAVLGQPPEPELVKQKPMAVEKSHSEKIVKVNEKAAAAAVKKTPSVPSLFFIGGGDQELFEQQEELEEFDHHEELTGQELFHKAETFIENFYQQLKMQREESWKKIHGLYQKAF